jgi:hypothetical protein
MRNEEYPSIRFEISDFGFRISTHPPALSFEFLVLSSDPSPFLYWAGVP